MTVSSVTVSVLEKQRHKDSRRGRAPPIDLFNGEDPSVRLDDWLPGLNLASQWNGWTPEEKLIHLAGHLRGRAEAEWNLLGDDETSDFETAVHNLRERLDPCSKVLAGQDFRRTVQTDNETVAGYIYADWRKLFALPLAMTSLVGRLEKPCCMVNCKRGCIWES